MDVDIPVLTGHLILPAQTGFSLNLKTKKKSSNHKHCQLFKASRHGIERLEICDKDDNKNPKIVTLENCVKITQEPAPANLIHIITKTESLTLNALNEDDLKEWVTSLQNIAFCDKSGEINNNRLLTRNSCIEEENDLYYTSFSDSTFRIRLLPSDVLNYCNLEAFRNYILQLTSSEIQLKSSDESGKIHAKFPYCFIRKYGYRDGRFTFEAGRKCETGAGEFHVDNANPLEIFRCMAAKMKSIKKFMSSDSMIHLDCGDHQWNAAMLMEAGSRTPIAPSSNHQHMTILGDNDTSHSNSSIHLFGRGFLSSNDSLGNLSSSTSLNLCNSNNLLGQQQLSTTQQQQQQQQQHQNSISSSSISSMSLNKNNPNKSGSRIIIGDDDQVSPAFKTPSPTLPLMKYKKITKLDPVTLTLPLLSVSSQTMVTSVSPTTSTSTSTLSDILMNQKLPNGTIVLKTPPSSEANKTLLTLIIPNEKSQYHQSSGTPLSTTTAAAVASAASSPITPTHSTTSLMVSNATTASIIDNESPPELPIRNESKNHNITDADYECIEAITDAWKTLGLIDVNHTEHIVTPEDELAEFVWQRSQSQKNKNISERDKKLYFTDDGGGDGGDDTKDKNYLVTGNSTSQLLMNDKKKSISTSNIRNSGSNFCIIDDNDSDTYDTLEFFAANTKQSSEYKTVVSVGNQSTNSGVKKQISNDYEIIDDPDTKSCRLADDSNLGYGKIRKPFTISSPLVSTAVGATMLTDAEMLDHERINGLEYAVVSKPKRV